MTAQKSERIVFLDQGSLAPQDLDWSAWSSLTVPIEFFDHTEPSQVEERLRGATIVVTNKVVLSRELIDASPSLKCISVAATGTNNIDLKSAHAAKIEVHNARDYGTESVAQHTWMLILALSNRLVEYRELLEEGAWSNNPSFALLQPPKSELTGRVLGIVGLGTLGRAVASKAAAFGMSVRALTPHSDSHKEQVAGVMRLPFEELLATCDVLSLHCPLDERNHHLINQRSLRAMKPSALLINTARGGLIDHDALVTALREGIIAGAALDTLDIEPPPANHPALQARLPNLLITPHNAWGSRLSRQTLVDQTLENIQGFLAGTPIRRIEES